MKNSDDVGSITNVSKLKSSFLPSRLRDSGIKPPTARFPDPSTSKVIQKNYTLNDSEAIKKKIKAERRNDVAMKEVKAKASLFEFFKHNIIQDLQQDPNIMEVKMVKELKLRRRDLVRPLSMVSHNFSVSCQ